MTIIAQQGQTWDMISYIAYGNEFYTKELRHANTKYHDTIIFDGGEEIMIPEIEDTGENPWK